MFINFIFRLLFPFILGGKVGFLNLPLEIFFLCLAFLLVSSTQRICIQVGRFLNLIFISVFDIPKALCQIIQFLKFLLLIDFIFIINSLIFLHSLILTLLIKLKVLHFLIFKSWSFSMIPLFIFQNFIKIPPSFTNYFPTIRSN